MTNLLFALHPILSSPLVYSAFNYLIERRSGIRKLIEYLGLSDNDDILDIGCGTATIVAKFDKDVNYTGIDASKPYIGYAQKRFGNQGQFLNLTVEELAETGDQKFDKIMAIGLLHHLSKDEAMKLLRFSKSVMKPNARFVSLDCCYVDNQSKVSKFIIDHDRGIFVRTLNEYQAMLGHAFETVKVTHHTDLLRIPYDHAIGICSVPQQS